MRKKRELLQECSFLFLAYLELRTKKKKKTKALTIDSSLNTEESCQMFTPEFFYAAKNKYLILPFIKSFSENSENNFEILS